MRNVSFMNFSKKILIVLTILFLEDFLKFININMLFYFPVGAGISINPQDMLVFAYLFYFFISTKKDRISLLLRILLIYLGFCILSVVFISIFAYHSNLGTIGNRLRYYFNYSLIIGLILLVDGKHNLKFLIYVIFSIGVIACCIHFIEYFQGHPFYVSGAGVSSIYFIDGAGNFDGMTRLWNRAPSCTMIMFMISLAFVASHTKNRILFTITIILSLSSIIISLTRTVYVFSIISIISVLLSSIFVKQGKPLFLGALVIIIGTVGTVYVMTKKPDMSHAISTRFMSIINIFTEGIDNTTMVNRQKQVAFLKRKLIEADVPPILGVGITNESSRLMTTDLGYMNIITNMGLLGIIFIIWVFLYLFIKSKQLMIMACEDINKFIGMSIFCMLPGLLLIGYNFDYFTGTYFALLAIPVTLLEAACYSESLSTKSI